MSHPSKPLDRPWSFEYDADASGDPLEFHTCQAAILGPQGELIVEEPGPEATWVELEHIVRCVNSHDALLDIVSRLHRLATGTHHDWPHIVMEGSGKSDDPDTRTVLDLLAIALAEGETP